MEDKISNIIEKLIEGTTNGNINWVQKPNFLNLYEYSYIKNDTEYNIYINLIQNTINFLNSFLVIRNEKLHDGKILINNLDNKNIDNLNKLIYDKYIKPTLKIINTNDILSDLVDDLNGLDEIRDNKINEIIEDKLPIKENIIDNKKKSFFGKWFK